MLAQCNDLVSVQILIALFSVMSMSWRHSSFSLQKKQQQQPPIFLFQKKFWKCFTDVKSALPSLITAYHLTHQTCSSQIVYASVQQPYQP